MVSKKELSMVTVQLLINFIVLFILLIGFLLETDFWACGVEAANHFYQGKERKKALVINNAIEVEQFLFNEKAREKLREEYCIPGDCLVVGQVSRLYEKQKNQSFFVKVFSELVKKEPNIFN